MVHSCAFVLHDAAENGLVARHVMLCAFGNSPDAVTVVNITGSKQWHRCSAFLAEAPADSVKTGPHMVHSKIKR